MSGRALVKFLVVGAAMLLTPASAAANPITVNTTHDTSSPSECVLRDAIAAANTDGVQFGGCAQGSGTDVLTVAATGPISLATALPPLASNLTIQGPGAGQLTVIRNSVTPFRIFTISPAATVTISGLTASNGEAFSTGNSASPISAAGGGISNSGNLTLDGVVVTGSKAKSTNTGAGNAEARGGGVDTDIGSLTMKHSTITGNGTEETVSGGVDVGLGGGLAIESGTATIDQNTLTNNSTTGLSASGGGIWVKTGTVRIERSTLTGNHQYGNGSGAGIGMSGGSVSLASDTIANNGPDNSTGVAIYQGGGALNAINTLVTEPTSSPSLCVMSTFTSLGHNLEFPGTDCGFTAPGDIQNKDPLLAGLADNGGPTMTDALLTGSPAIDAGSSPGESADQRGLVRASDFPSVANAAGSDGSDIGAFEGQYSAPAVPAPSSRAHCKKSKKKKKHKKSCKRKKKHHHKK